jgi:hypothetical protein
MRLVLFISGCVSADALAAAYRNSSAKDQHRLFCNARNTFALISPNSIGLEVQKCEEKKKIP